jgi:hypothetical protein
LQDGQGNPTPGQDVAGISDNNGTSNGSVPANPPPDSSSSSPDSQNNPTSDSSSTGQSTNQQSPIGSSQGSTSPVVPSAGKSNSDPATGLTPSTNTGAVIAAGDGTSASANVQGSTPDKRQQGQTGGSASDGEQHGPVGASEAKLHSPDGPLSPGEGLHAPIAVATSAVEQGIRYQAGIPSQQQNGTRDDSAPRPVEPRVPPVDGSQASGIAETLPTSADGPSTRANDLSEILVRDDGLSNVSPQNHGLLTNGLFGVPFPLRSEVESFFSQIEHLGEQPTDKRIGMILSSTAVLVGAAMACEIARRQARRRTTGPTFAPPYADAPSGIGLPNLGQFSVLS